MLGISRANIRFYEKQGLLSPARKDNNYRDYDDDDVKLLKKIIVLRKLGVGLEEICGLENGEKQLDNVLNENIQKLETEISRLEGSLELSKLIAESNAVFSASAFSRRGRYSHRNMYKYSGDKARNERVFKVLYCRLHSN